MLRITIHDDPEFLTFQLEGRLAEDGVRALHDCWKGTRGASSRPAVRFDLRDVTYIDAKGKAFLAARRAHGATLIASGCLIRAIVAEIADSCAPSGECAHAETASQRPS